MTTSEALDEHCKEAHTFICIKCNTAFCSKNECDAHMKLVHTKEGTTTQRKESQFECLACKVTFETELSLKEHMIAEHFQECQICANKFKTRTLLKDHITRVHVVQCKHCSTTMHSQDEMS